VEVEVEVEAVGTWREEGVHDLGAVPVAAAAAEELARECMRPASAIICTPATVRAAADSATVAAEESCLRPLAPPAALPLFPEAPAVTGAWWEPSTPYQKFSQVSGPVHLLGKDTVESTS